MLPYTRSRTWDHPRSRGVYADGSEGAGVVWGSSPLARGLPAACTPSFRTGGIIPARAGFTRVRLRQGGHDRDHPRSRGVYHYFYPALNPEFGSSPLARGLRPGRRLPGSPARIIPARAGFTRAHDPHAGRDRDHPRSRGVYSIWGSACTMAPGSSPLARGLPYLGGGSTDGPRIIPARAGFTAYHEGLGVMGRDHPRSRGVYPPSGVTPGLRRGSSPLARGLPKKIGETPTEVRIIPARAGFTRAGQDRVSGPADHPRSRGVYRRRQIRGRRPRDHPRSRGVYAAAASTEQRIGGSSPLARGLPDADCSALVAGADHPRSRGVYMPEIGCRLTVEGSSPLARGLRSMS